jgi:sterol desaturase/sphingolipid hydroxylase (fatty acid hydroxylase superfamily)
LWTFTGRFFFGVRTCEKQGRNEQAIYSWLAGAIFLIAAIVHASRTAFHWQVVLAGWRVPVWISAVAMVVAAFLAYEGVHAKS